MVVFSFAAFAVMYSLTKSARQTAFNRKSPLDDVDFESTEKKYIEYNFTIGQDLDFIERDKLVKRFCALIAEKEKPNLYGKSETFSLDENILEDRI